MLPLLQANHCPSSTLSLTSTARRTGLLQHPIQTTGSWHAIAYRWPRLALTRLATSVTFSLKRRARAVFGAPVAPKPDPCSSMQLQAKPRAAQQAGRASGRARSVRTKVVCQAQTDASSRRNMLLAGVAAAASPLILVKGAQANVLTDGKLEKAYLEVKDLSTIYKNLQRQEFLARTQGVLREILTADDAPYIVSLALHDACSYDVTTKTGGFDGSIALNQDELNRPENAGLKSTVEKLAKAKELIDAGFTEGGGPISWADTIYLGGKVANQKKWTLAKLTANPTNGELIAQSFPNPWPIEIGRLDSTEAGPVRSPPADADVETIRQFLRSVGAKPGAGSGPFDGKPILYERPAFLLWTASVPDSAAEEARFAAANPNAFAGIKTGYDKSRRSVTRTDYEVDFANAWNKLCNIGAKFNKTAYLHRVEVRSLG